MLFSIAVYLADVMTDRACAAKGSNMPNSAVLASIGVVLAMLEDVILLVLAARWLNKP